MSFISRIFQRVNPVKRDAETIYNLLMTQSRLTTFFGPKKFPDNYDGRIDVLTLHMAIILEALNRFGDNGRQLSQALFDHMKDDFEIALREEGLSDTGVKKRIKPMISLFYSRVKAYSDGFDKNETASLADAFHHSSAPENKTPHIGFSTDFISSLDNYVVKTRDALKSNTLGDIALGKFTFHTI